MAADFYRAFEDKHRGSRALIKSRLRVYLPFLGPLAAMHPDSSVLDLGCGRGEWLELLRDNGVPARGVDLDDGMLAACRERGLAVEQGDALACLKAQPDQCLLAVSGFHVAEHLPFALLQELFAEARRVLLPGGVLILETPNPENLLVGASSFYIDPTHERPLPFQLLEFLPEYAGFARIKLLRLQEEARLVHGEVGGLYDVLAGVSPDYAIVAQVSAAALPASLEEAFAAESGVSLFGLATRYDEQLQQRFLAQAQAAHAAHARAEESFSLAANAQARVEQLALRLAELDDRAARQAAELAAVYNSQSWRITRPLRWLVRQFRSRQGGS